MYENKKCDELNTPYYYVCETKTTFSRFINYIVPSIVIKSWTFGSVVERVQDVRCEQRASAPGNVPPPPRQCGAPVVQVNKIPGSIPGRSTIFAFTSLEIGYIYFLQFAAFIVKSYQNRLSY